MNEGLATVQARVTQIQALVQGLSGPRTTSVRATSTGSSAASRTTFEEVLARAGSNAESSTPGEQAVSVAKKYLGVDYRWGGTDPKTGLDCSGLTRLVYGQLGVSLPRTSGEQATSGTKINSLAQAKPGDLVFFGSPVHHVGIYVGDGKMLDAPRTGKQVQIRAVYETPSAIRRVLPEGSGNAGSTNSAMAGLLGPAGSATGSATRGLGASSGGLSGTPYADLFTSAGRRYGVDPALLSAVAKAESAYRPTALSPAGARGLMQLMPATARSLGVNPDQPAEAVDGAARLLSDHLRTFNGRVDLALAAYNAGPGAVRKYGGVPPYAETRTYVQRVTKNWGDLR
ncbi:MAG TPA: NlpC/P60 family protein [Kineosporiaceae bacterium]|nr:NlpC/P60 family protein [Kineosporiaceae bacterium]